ncbi:hypothetical protein EPUL_004999 [Erysiphe pulchra]|uniref:Uncharacterized protein n=1 Tax=Erysiphe pulchra TaxID=225359 RepID=A0A2S4PLX8_9PEZI|nr:hypothetical protein EPUL_004999 [Erysiphe pulchra]
MSKINLSQPEPSTKKSLKLSEDLKPGSSSLTLAPKRKFNLESSTQYHSLQPQSSTNVMNKEGAINVYRPVALSEFLSTNLGRKPDGPLREASSIIPS